MDKLNWGITLIMVGSFVLMLTIIITGEISKTKANNLPCYDNHNQIISELKCEGYTYPTGYRLETMLPGAILIIVGALLTIWGALKDDII